MLSKLKLIQAFVRRRPKAQAIGRKWDRVEAYPREKMRRWELKLITIRGEGVAGLLGGNIGFKPELVGFFYLLGSGAPGEVVFLGGTGF